VLSVNDVVVLAFKRTISMMEVSFKQLDTATTNDGIINAFHVFCLQLKGSAPIYDSASGALLALGKEDTDTEPSQEREGV